MSSCAPALLHAAARSPPRCALRPRVSVAARCGAIRVLVADHPSGAVSLPSVRASSLLGCFAAAAQRAHRCRLEVPRVAFSMGRPSVGGRRTTEPCIERCHALPGGVGSEPTSPRFGLSPTMHPAPTPNPSLHPTFASRLRRPAPAGELKR